MVRRQRIRRDILDFLKNHGTKSFRIKDLSKRLNFEDSRDYRLFREIIEELRTSGTVGTVKGGQITYRPRTGELTGILTVHRDGFGFVSVDGEDEDYFIRARRMETAIDGDTVVIGAAAQAKGDRRKSAEIRWVVKRARTSAVGTLHHADSYAIVIPDDLRLNHDIYVSMEDLNEAIEGDKVVVSIDAFEDRRGAIHGKVLQVLGPSTDARVQTLAVAMSQGVFSDFPDPVEEEAACVNGEIKGSEHEDRLDLRKKLIFTIDPADARDFDDALHIETRDDGQIELGVHIADVSHFVQENSAIDKEAYRRGTSVYLVDRVIPMLPDKLSSDACSLLPHTDRLAFSCILTLSKEGKVLSSTFEETIIHSHHRLTYEDAQEILGNPDSKHALRQPLVEINALARKLSAERRTNGSIDFGMSEVQIELDEAGHPIAIRPKERLDTHRLIEECMLLANRVVAEALGNSNFDAFISRIHEHPDRERLKNLSQYVRAFGYELAHSEGLVKPADLNTLLESVRGKPEAPVIEHAALRAMAKARYGIETTGHYGLAFRHYTHFTSPIRRYPDLVVHRLVKRMVTGARGYEVDKLKKICEHSSERERVAVDAERASVALKKVIYAADHIGDEFDGI
ncbi:MAG: ribonuclease R, partial [Bacteroidetes bacterium]